MFSGGSKGNIAKKSINLNAPCHKETSQMIPTDLHWINPFQPIVALQAGASYLIDSANQSTGFYIEYNNWAEID